MSEVLTARPSVGAPTPVVDALRRCDPFAALPEAALRRVAAASTLRNVRRGERLWEHNSPAAAVAVVVAGRVKCWSPGHAGRQWVSSVARPGMVCGLAANVAAGDNTCTAEPLERSRVVLVPQATLHSVLEDEPDFARHVARALARDVRRLLGACEDVTLRTPLERLAHYLRTAAQGAGAVELPETQTQIAAQLGTVREVVGRSFRRLEARGVVARTGRLVRILDARALDALAAS